MIKKVKKISKCCHLTNPLFDKIQIQFKSILKIKEQAKSTHIQLFWEILNVQKPQRLLFIPKLKTACHLPHSKRFKKSLMEKAKSKIRINLFKKLMNKFFQEMKIRQNIIFLMKENNSLSKKKHRTCIIVKSTSLWNNPLKKATSFRESWANRKLKI